jgi:GGDEF domain-containing protein
MHEDLVISIGHSIAELERYERERNAAVACYRTAIQNLAQYTVDLTRDLTEPQRKYLEALAATVTPGSEQTLAESQGTLRGLLRDYRDKAARYLAEMREELIGTTRALEEILDSLSQSDGDSESRVRAAAVKLREVAELPAAEAIRSTLLSAAGSIDEGLDQIHKQHQLAIAQFQVEIRMLHKRIDSLEAAETIDSLTKLCGRSEMEERLKSAPPGYCLLLARASGIRLAESRFGAEVAGELAGAFVRRLRNCLHPTALIGRWSTEEFVALISVPKTEAIKLAKFVGEQLSGSYACIRNGKTVRPSLQLSVATVESAGSTPDRVRQQVAAFLVG